MGVACCEDHTLGASLHPDGAPGDYLTEEHSSMLYHPGKSVERLVSLRESAERDLSEERT